MKKITLATLFMGCAIAFGQVTAPSFNRWSLDASFGTNKAVRQFTPGYYSGIANFSSLQIGGRYMFSSTSGFDVSVGHDRFKEGGNSLEFNSQITRLNMQIVLNLANTFNFYEWTERIGLFAHTGVGLGMINSEANTSNLIGSMMVGLTPQIKLTNKLAVNFDLSVVGNARQGYTFDGNTSLNEFSGLNATFWTHRVGINYYFGGYDTHADWTPTKGVTANDMEAMRAELAKMRKGMKDDDADGVPNYLDKEPATPAGNMVDAKGVTDPNRMDTDMDGLADNFDDCPEEEGKFSTNGCPDMDNDGVADADDKCPDQAGTAANNGCPGGNNAKVDIDAGMSTVYFDVAKSTLNKKEVAKVNQLIDLMNANPTYNVVIKGHADRVGSFELNQALSQSRATSVQKYMVQKGIDPLRITTVAYGASFPATTEDTPAARARNRRVEFEVRN